MNKLQQAIQIKEELEQHLQHHYGRRAPSALALAQYLLLHPAITIEDAATAIGLSYKASNDLVALFVRDGYLKEITGQSRHRIFIFDKYLTAFGNE